MGARRGSAGHRQTEPQGGRHRGTKGEGLEAILQLLLLLLQALNGSHGGSEELLGPSGGFGHSSGEKKKK